MANKNDVYIILIIIVSLSILLISCSKDETITDDSKIYELKADETLFKGKITSKERKIYDIDPFDLLFENGDFVKEGDKLSDLDRVTVQEVNSLTNNKDKLKNEINQLKTMIDNIKNGTAKNFELELEKENLNELIMELEIMKDELAFNMRELDEDYNNEKLSVQHDLELNRVETKQMQNQLKELENMDELNDSIKDEITQLKEQIKDLNKEKDTFDHQLLSIDERYKSAKERIVFEKDNTNKKLSKNESLLHQLVQGDTAHPFIAELIQSIKSEKQELANQLEEVERQLTDLENNPSNIALFDGQLVLTNDQVILYATEYLFVLKITESQLERLQELKHLELDCLSDDCPKVTLKSIVSIEDVVDTDDLSYYNLTYDIDSKADTFHIKHGQTEHLKVVDDIYIPEEYVEIENENYYIYINSERTPVSIKEEKNQFILTKGAKVGDLVEKVVND